MDRCLKRYPVQTNAFHFDRLNVPFLAACSFLVHQLCFLEGYRTCIHLSYHDLPLAVYYTKVEYITRLNQLGGLGDDSIDQDSAAPRRPGPAAEGSPESRPFARHKANKLALRNPALTPRCGRPAGPVAKLAGPNVAVVGQRDRTPPGEPSSLGGTERNDNRRACQAATKINLTLTRLAPAPLTLYLQGEQPKFPCGRPTRRQSARCCRSRCCAGPARPN